MAAPKGKKFAIGNKGKPKLFKTPEDLQNSIDEYFKKCLIDPYFARQTSTALLNDGYLTYYSVTNPENDFNIYAEQIFLNDKTLENYYINYPKIRKKVDFVKSAYIMAGFNGNFPKRP